MMQIAVCDSDPHCTNALVAAIQRFCTGRPDGAELRLFAGAPALMEALGTGYRPNLVFVAILKDSLDAARSIRALDPDCLLVLMAETPALALQGYSVHAYSYLLKPVREESIAEILESVYTILPKEIELKINGIPIRIPCTDLAYVESDRHHIMFHVHNRVIQAVGKLDQYEEKLVTGGSFLRCHQSYLVNMDHIRKVEGAKFLLRDGTFIPIRRPDAAKFKSIFYSRIINSK